MIESTPKKRRGGPSGKNRQPSMLVRAPRWALDLYTEAAERSNNSQADWLRTALIIQAAEELGLDPIAALGGRRVVAR